MRKKGGKEKSLKAQKTSEGKYKYKMVGVLTENGEKGIWKTEAEKEGVPLSEFVRDAVNARIMDIRPAKDTLTDTGELDRLKQENQRLEKEKRELSEEVEKLKQELSILRDAYTSKTGDWLDKILAVIPEDGYKKPRDILIDAGLIKEWSSDEEWYEAQQRFQDEIREFSEKCEKEGKPFPLIYTEGRGWKHK